MQCGEREHLKPPRHPHHPNPATPLWKAAAPWEFNRLKHYVHDGEAGGYKVIDEAGRVKGGVHVHDDRRMRHVTSIPDGEKVKDEVVSGSTPDDGYEKVRFLPALYREEVGVLPFDIYFRTPADRVLRIDTKGEKIDVEADPDKMIDDGPAVMY